jgi:hypothetical protein
VEHLQLCFGGICSSRDRANGLKAKAELRNQVDVKLHITDCPTYQYLQGKEMHGLLP